MQTSLGDAVFGEVLEGAALRRPTGNSGECLRDLEAVRVFSSSQVLLSLLDIPRAPLFLGAIFVFHPLLGWLGLAGAVVLILVTLLNQFLTRRREGVAQEQSAMANRFSAELLRGGDYVWAQAMRPAMLERWTAIQDTALAQKMAANDWTGVFSAFSKAFRLLLQSGMLALGALLVLRNEMTAGAMIAASIMLGRGLAPIEQTLSQWSAVQRAHLG